MMYQVGEKIQVRSPAFTAVGTGLLGKLLTGTVIYVHPRMRYIRAEFKLPGGTFRESFLCYKSGVLR